MHAAQIRPRVGATRRGDTGRDDGAARRNIVEIEINAMMHLPTNKPALRGITARKRPLLGRDAPRIYRGRN